MKTFKEFMITESRDANDLSTIAGAKKFADFSKTQRSKDALIAAIDKIISGYISDNLYKAEYSEIYSYELSRPLEGIYSNIIDQNRPQLDKLEEIDRDAYWDMLSFSFTSSAKLARYARKYQKILPLPLSEFLLHFENVKKELDKIKSVLKSGRKPKELTPEQAAKQFYKPMISKEAASLATRISKEAVVRFEQQFRSVVHSQYITTFNKLSACSTTEELKSFFDDGLSALILGRFFKLDKIKKTITPLDNASEKEVIKLADGYVNEVIAGFIAKNVSKLALIFQKKAAISEYKVARTRAVSGMVECSMFFKFDDNSKFTVYSNVESSYSSKGTYFLRYPTRFTEVYFSDGTKMSMPSEEKMIKNF